MFVFGGNLLEEMILATTYILFNWNVATISFEDKLQEIFQVFQNSQYNVRNKDRRGKHIFRKVDSQIFFPL